MRGIEVGTALTAAAFALVTAVACGEDSGGGNPGDSGDAGAGGSIGGGGAGGAGTGGGVPGTGGGGAGTGGTGTGGAPSCPEFSPEPGALPELGLQVLLETDIFGVNPVGIVESQLYFIDDGEFFRVPVAGGPAETLGPIETDSAFMPRDDLLVWQESQMEGGVAILTAPLSDPTSETILVADVADLQSMTADADHLYYGTRTDPNVYRVPLSGGAPELFVPGAQPLGDLVHGGYFWWLDFQTSQLERVPLAGGPREPLAEVHFGGPMAGEGDTVFWGDTSLNTVEKWSPATGRDQLAGADPNTVAVSGGVVYWTDGFITGSVRSVNADGTGSRGILCGLTSPGALFIEGDTLVVVADEGILRMDR